MLRNATIALLCLCSTACGPSWDPFKTHNPITVTDGGVTCQAFPACDPGDQLALGTCPTDADCYEVSACGYTAMCAHYSTLDGGAHCEAYPACRPGDTEIFDGSCTGENCYELTVCGYTITCEQGLDGGVSEPDGGQCDGGHHHGHDGGVYEDGGVFDGGEFDAGAYDGGAHCDLFIGCAQGYELFPGGSCPANASECYTQTICDSTIACARFDGVDGGWVP